jgi:Ser/Thr protein kinase RdoA (MazF antagonist)
VRLPKGIAERFGIDGATARELRGGWVNDNWLVTGADGADYVVRRYGRLEVTRETIAFEHAVMRHAAAHGASVAAPLDSLAGDSIVSEGDAYYAILPYVAGETGNRASAAFAAAALGRLHVALADFHAPSQYVMKSADALGLLAEAFRTFAVAPEVARKLDWAALIAAVEAAAERVRPAAGALPLATVHGDPHPDNFVVCEGRIAALLDFDFSHASERAYDVASGAETFGRADEDAPIDADRAVAFAAAYQPELGAEEWHRLPDLMIRRNAFLVWYVVTRHGRRSDGDIGNADRYARRILELAAGRHDWSAR